MPLHFLQLSVRTKRPFQKGLFTLTLYRCYILMYPSAPLSGPNSPLPYVRGTEQRLARPSRLSRPCAASVHGVSEGVPALPVVAVGTSQIRWISWQSDIINVWHVWCATFCILLSVASFKKRPQVWGKSVDIQTYRNHAWFSGYGAIPEWSSKRRWIISARSVRRLPLRAKNTCNMSPPARCTRIELAWFIPQEEGRDIVSDFFMHFKLPHHQFLVLHATCKDLTLQPLHPKSPKCHQAQQQHDKSTVFTYIYICISIQHPLYLWTGL